MSYQGALNKPVIIALYCYIVEINEIRNSYKLTLNIQSTWSV